MVESCSSGTMSQIKFICFKVPLVMVFYHINRKVTNDDAYPYVCVCVCVLYKIYSENAYV